MKFKTGLILSFFLLISFELLAKDNIAILPFSGGTNDEREAIAEILSFDKALNSQFGIIPRTSISLAIEREQKFQMSSGMTDPDTIANIGHQLGAQYVMTGKITNLGNKKLLIISIIKIESIQQVAGDFVTYTRMEDSLSTFSLMIRNIIAMLEYYDAPSLTKLTVTPVQLRERSNSDEPDTLAQILAIHLIRSRKYSIYPRTSSLEQVQREFYNQMSGITSDESIARLGYGVNPEFILSVVARQVGTMNMFNASIIDLSKGNQIIGITREYITIEDGLRAMESLASELSGVTIRRTDNLELWWRRQLANENKFIGFGASVGSAFTTPYIIGTVNAIFSPFSYTFFDIGCDIGFIHANKQRNDVDYFSLFPFVNFNGFLPIWGGFNLYVGVGSGLMIAFYSKDNESHVPMIPTFNSNIGILYGKNNHYISVNYILRTTFEIFNHKTSVGYLYRFK
jgi:TolB-like protein